MKSTSFREYYLTEQAQDRDPREKEKMKFFGDQIQKVFGLKMGRPVKDRGDFVFIFKSKGFNLGRTTLRLQSSFGDIIFGESSGVFTSQDAQKAKEKIQNAYDKKFGARGVEGAKSLAQLMKELAKEKKKPVRGKLG